MTGEFEGEDSEVLRREHVGNMLLDSLVVEREVRTADSTNRTAKLLLGRSRWRRSVDLSMERCWTRRRYRGRNGGGRVE